MKKHAYSLIEVVVAVGVVGILLAIALPAVGAARRIARGLQCMSNIRSCAQAVTGYTVDSHGYFPFFADFESDPAFENGGIGLSFLWQSYHWPMVMGDRLGRERFSETRFCPGNPILDESIETIESWYPESYIYPSDFFLAYGCFTDPRLWRENAEPSNAELYHAIASADVTFPSMKGILVELTPYHRMSGFSNDDMRRASLNGENPTGRFHVSFADGSTRSINQTALAPGVQPGTTAPGTPVLATKDGVHGIDLQDP